MALSGNFSTNKYSGTVGLNLSWTGTQSVANNTTTIKWTLKSEGGGSSNWWYAGPITVTIGGKTVLSVTSRFKLYGSGAYKKTGSVTITHNEDGTRSVGMSVKAAIYSASVNCTGSHTFTLNKIDRYALITSFENFTNEYRPTISYSNPAGTELVTGLKIRIKWKDTNDQDQATAWHILADDGSDSPYTFTSSTLTDQNISDMLAACPNSKTLAVKYELQSTLGGNDYSDEKDAIMTIVNSAPIIAAGSLTYADTNANVVAITGSTAANPIIVRKQSELTINIDETGVEAQNFASISSYLLIMNATSYTPDANGNIVIDKPDISGTFQAMIYITDSRGFISTQGIDITIYDWQIPSATYTIDRKNGFEDETVLKVNATYSDVNSINVVTITEQYRKKGSSTWLPATPETVPNNTDLKINYPTGLDKQYEWEVKITVTDLFLPLVSPAVTVEYIEAVGKGVPLFYPVLNRNSISINGFPDEDNQLHVEGTVKIIPNDTDAGIKLPHEYSDTEQIVGYWIDGSPIYEKTIELSGNQTINADDYCTISTSDWSLIAIPIDIVLYRYGNISSQSQMAIRSCFAAINNSGQLQIFSTRNAAITFNAFTIQYVKIPQT